MNIRRRWKAKARRKIQRERSDAASGLRIPLRDIRRVELVLLDGKSIGGFWTFTKELEAHPIPEGLTAEVTL